MKGARRIALILGAGVAFATPVAFATVPDAQLTEHARAAAALADIKVAIAAIMIAENGTTSGAADYVFSAKSAINALVGTKDPAFYPNVPNPGDATGSMGQVNALLDQTATPPYVNALHGVQINELAAVGFLQDAVKARGLDEFQTAASKALQNLEIAQGRSSEYDVLGGMLGAIANTSLAVPDGAPTADGCAAPTAAGYGVHHGWLAWHAVKAGTASIPAVGIASIKKENGMLVLYTAAAPMVQQNCATHAAAPAAIKPSAYHPPVERPSLLIEAAAHKAASAALYTAAQAASGKAIYATDCASCHGANLQGVAAPAIAGTEFLKTATKNKYTVSILNTIVTQNMPFNNPGSLKPEQYADVMAYLLAANCYPAGKTAFPTDPSSSFGTAVVAVQTPPSSTPDKLGVCAVP
jgi:polar amino acid transport system substrate-binding protein